MHASCERILVAAGLVIEGTRVLLTQRRSDQDLGGYWELPGGKVEPGEAPLSAVIRELEEELGIVVTTGPIWEVLHHRYPTYEVVMLVYPCWCEAGSMPLAIEVAQFVWCDVTDLHNYDILPADTPIIARLQTEGTPACPTTS